MQLLLHWVHVRCCAFLWKVRLNLPGGSRQGQSCYRIVKVRISNVVNPIWAQLSQQAQMHPSLSGRSIYGIPGSGSEKYACASYLDGANPYASRSSFILQISKRLMKNQTHAKKIQKGQNSDFQTHLARLVETASRTMHCRISRHHSNIMFAVNQSCTCSSPPVTWSSMISNAVARS